MELETLFTEQKWNILQSLSKQKYSPLQLAKMHNTTIANISQQLRLLEAANLVKKEKIPNRERGKPRTLFSLSHDYSYMISAMSSFAKKKLLELSDYHKFILKIWFLENSDLHYYVEKFYWKLEPYLHLIEAIAVNTNKKDIDIILFSKHIKFIKSKITDEKIKKKEVNIKVKFFSEEDIKKQSNQIKSLFDSFENMFVLYDPNNLLSLFTKEVIVS